MCYSQRDLTKEAPRSCNYRRRGHKGMILMSAQTVSLSSLASEAHDYFETAKRADSEQYYLRVKDGAPEWLQDLCREAHHCGWAGELMFPDDWRYEAIYAALGHIADSGAETIHDLEDQAHEFADSHVDVYNDDRAKWLGSHHYRSGYVDEARDEGLIADDADLMAQLGVGQYEELSEVFHAVARFLSDRISS